jgi:hypothetical protein
MLKHALAILALSAAIILSMSYAQHGVQLLMSAHAWVAQLLTEVFSQGQAGNLARGLIALLAIPLLAGLVPGFIYWLLRRQWFPYFMQIVWVVWLVQVGALVTMYQAV